MREPPPNTDRAGVSAGCDAGIVFAVPIEADAFSRLATDQVEMRSASLAFHEGRVQGRRVAWCVAGVGAEAASNATRLLIAGHRPAVVISAGFAGGLDPAVARGSLVRPIASIGESDADPLPLWTGDDPFAGGGLTIVSVATIQATVEAKRRLFERTGAQVVDMETHAVARVAAEAGIRCGSIRVVSDDALQSLPREVESLARPQSAWRRLGSVVGAIGRRPAAVADLWRLWEHAVVDGRTLAHALTTLIADLPGEPSRS